MRPKRPDASASPDAVTAAAFSRSWNRLGMGSVYTRDQFLDWFAPITPDELEGKTVLELGFGNGSLLYHMAHYRPSRLCGVELGDTFERAKLNLSRLPAGTVELHRGDLTEVDLGWFDLVYCIGVLHHLKDPEAGFKAVLEHTRPGGRFHCWVYAHEGNAVVRTLVDPVRKVTSRLPWWVTKYGVAMPLVLPYFVYTKLVKCLAATAGEPRARRLPLGSYCLWIGRREFSFFHHVDFAQLVTPQTTYIRRPTVERWLDHPDVEPSSRYILCRNGNSWKFGGRKASHAKGLEVAH